MRNEKVKFKPNLLPAQSGSDQPNNEYVLRLQALFNNALDSIICLDDDGRYVEANPAASTLLGYSRRELLQKTIWDLSPDKTWTSKLWRQFLADGHLEGEYRLLKKNGLCCEVEFRAVANILPGLHFSAIRDITERKRAEDALRHSEQRFIEFMRNLPGAAFIKDESGRYVYDNYAVEKLLKLRPRSRIGKTDSDFLPPKTAKRFAASDNQVIQSGRSHQLIERVEMGNRTISWLVTKFPIPSDIGKCLIGGVAIDITELQKAEEEIKKRVFQQQAVAEFGLRTLHCDDLTQLMNDAANVVAKTLMVDHALVLQFTEGSFLLKGRNGKMKSRSREIRTPASSDVWCGFAYQSRSTIIVSDVRYEKRFHAEPLLRGLKVVSGLTVIIHGAGEPYGILGVYAKKQRKFSQEDAGFLQAVANALAAAIDRNRRQKQIEDHHHQLQLLSNRLIETLEAERSHLARELHDEVGQVLSAVRLYLESAFHQSEIRNCQHKIQETMTVIDRALDQVHSISLGLRPPMLDDLGLIATLQWYITWHMERSPYKIRFDVRVPDRSKRRFRKEVETTCFRVVQEALTNVSRHANAENVFIHLSAKGSTLRLQIRDDGIGCDLKKVESRAQVGKCLGLVGMKERVRLAEGAMRLWSKKNQGTRLLVVFPEIWRQS